MRARRSQQAFRSARGCCCHAPFLGRVFDQGEEKRGLAVLAWDAVHGIALTGLRPPRRGVGRRARTGCRRRTDVSTSLVRVPPRERRRQTQRSRSPDGRRGLRTARFTVTRPVRLRSATESPVGIASNRAWSVCLFRTFSRCSSLTSRNTIAAPLPPIGETAPVEQPVPGRRLTSRGRGTGRFFARPTRLRGGRNAAGDDLEPAYPLELRAD